MPVRIGTIEDMSEEEFAALRRQKGRSTNQEMEDLLDRVESGRPQRVPLEEGQSARGLRVAIARAAGSRGLKVATIEGDGFVAVRKDEEQAAGRPKRQPAENGRRRGRPRRQDADVAAGDEVVAEEEG